MARADLHTPDLAASREIKHPRQQPAKNIQQNTHPTLEKPPPPPHPIHFVTFLTIPTTTPRRLPSRLI
jgi:hypothetical protein